MERYRAKGAITVFLSLLITLFLSLLCTATESARVQQTRGKAAAALDMGLFSLFGEFENQVLEQYDVFFLDGGCGTGSYSEAALEAKLKDYMAYNVSPNQDLLLTGYDPFGLTLDSVKITGTALATDGNGAAYYQQAVSFMKENLASEALSIWLERRQQAQELQEAQDSYEQKNSSSEQEMENLQQKQKQLEEEQKQSEQEGESGVERQTEAPETVPAAENPLETIKKIKKMGILGLALGDRASDVSGQKLDSDRPSARSRKTGTLSIEKSNQGLTSSLLFQEYLFERFSSYSDEETTEGVLHYGLEYILCGKKSDQKNLKSVILRLLLLREGANFLYLNQNAEKRSEAAALAELLTGAIPIPGLTAATTAALQLIWAYAESLMDLRVLFTGGKVPVLKSEQSWQLELKEIPGLLTRLDQAKTRDSSGLDYEGYLQILFTMGNTSAYPMRALDLLEGHIRKQSGYEGFRADHAVVKLAAKAEYTIPPLFLRISNAFLKTGTASTAYQAAGTFGYQK